MNCMKTFKAWGIALNNGGGGFIGRYYFGNRPMPEHLGMIPCAFENRRKAREYLPSVRPGYPKASVVRVTITVESI